MLTKFLPNISLPFLLSSILLLLFVDQASSLNRAQQLTTSYPNRRDPEPAYVQAEVPIGAKRFAELIQHYNRNKWMWDNGGGMAMVVHGAVEFMRRREEKKKVRGQKQKQILSKVVENKHTNKKWRLGDEKHVKPKREWVPKKSSPKAVQTSMGEESSQPVEGFEDTPDSPPVTEAAAAVELPAEEEGQDLIFVSPTGVQKEALKPIDVYVVPLDKASLQPKHHGKPNLPEIAKADFLQRSRNENSVPSATLNLLRYARLEHQVNADFSAKPIVAVVHTHSMYANMLTMSNLPGEGETLNLSHQEMAQAIEDRETGKFFDNLDEVVIPIVKSGYNEQLLLHPMMEKLRTHKKVSAVIVQRHGLFVWGQHSWQSIKQMVECYEYLLEMEFMMRQLKVQMMMAQWMDMQGLINARNGQFIDNRKDGGPKFRLEMQTASGFVPPKHLHEKPAPADEGKDAKDEATAMEEASEEAIAIRTPEARQQMDKVDEVGESMQQQAEEIHREHTQPQPS